MKMINSGATMKFLMLFTVCIFGMFFFSVGAFRLQKSTQSNQSNLIGTETSSSNTDDNSMSSSNISKCILQSRLNAKEETMVFYIPTSDESMYTEGVNKEAQQGDYQERNISISCTNISKENVDLNEICRICLYTEMLDNRNHLKHGQVKDVNISNCLQGVFNVEGKIQREDYHPMCYVGAMAKKNNL